MKRGIRPRARSPVILLGLVLLLAVCSGLAAQRASADPSDVVYVIPIEQTIESGLQSFLERAVAEAERSHADAIVFTINTFGGSVGAADGIGELIRFSRIPTVAFIQGKAISAGSYIALNAEQIVMADGSSIGSAAVVDLSGNRVTDSKTIAAWSGMMKSAAELRGRNPLYAAGMVDDQIVVEVPEIGKTYGKGVLISFTAKEALAAGYAEALASNLDGVLAHIGMADAQVIEVKPTIAENLARFLTNPYVMTILLLLGLGGVAIELFAPGFGVPGIVGVAAFVLYFFGHYVAGFAGLEHIVLFVAGIVLLMLEIFIPSFGILGIAGFISLVSGIILAAYKTEQALASLGLALLGAVLILFAFFRFFKHRGVWNKFILRDEFKTESGYVSSAPKQHLIGRTGTAVTVLRPAGIALIDDQRIDVVADGEFIQAGQAVRVVLVEGSRVVVRALKD
jgi:membrane-bound serine protease (ClpP class)